MYAWPRTEIFSYLIMLSTLACQACIIEVPELVSDRLLEFRWPAFTHCDHCIHACPSTQIISHLHIILSGPGVKACMIMHACTPGALKILDDRMKPYRAQQEWSTIRLGLKFAGLLKRCVFNGTDRAGLQGSTASQIHVYATTYIEE